VASCHRDIGGKFAAGIVETGGKFTVDTGGKFATGINDISGTGGKICRWCSSWIGAAQRRVPQSERPRIEP
jgi:hypothetical protein